MKRQRIDLADVAEIKNLARAAYLAGKGKRDRAEVARFFEDLGGNLNRLGAAIREQRMPIGGYRPFLVRDPKERLIHAACFEDRVFHHALIAHLGPILDQALTPNTYACRVGMGTHAAVREVQRQLRCHPWYVKIDVDAYFNRIPHRRLFELLEHRIKGDAVLATLWRVIDSYRVEPGAGLPIGALTSQHFANYYLNGCDRGILARPECRGLVRYMDDSIWWCRDRADAKRTLAWVRDFLWQERGLTIKRNAQINRSAHGVTYCGYRISAEQIRLSRRKQRRYAQQRLALEAAYRRGEIDALTLQQAYASVHAATLPADAKGWRRENLQRLPSIEA